MNIVKDVVINLRSDGARRAPSRPMNEGLGFCGSPEKETGRKGQERDSETKQRDQAFVVSARDASRANVVTT